MVTYRLTRFPTQKEQETQIVPGTTNVGGESPSEYAKRQQEAKKSQPTFVWGGGGGGGSSNPKPAPVQQTVQETKQIVESVRKPTPQTMQIKSQSPVNIKEISAYQKIPREQRIKSYEEGYGTEYNRPATAQERTVLGTGYNEFGLKDGIEKVSPTPTGKGTIIEREQIPIGDIATSEIARSRQDIQNKADMTAERIADELRPEYEEEISKVYNNLQEKVNKGEISVQNAQNSLNTFTKLIADKYSKEVEKKTLKQLEGDKDYKEKVEKSKQIAEKYGVKKDLYGKDQLAKYTQTKSEKEKETLKKGVLLGATFIPQATPFFFGSASAESGKGRLIIQPPEENKPLEIIKEEMTPKEKELITLGAISGIGGAFSLRGNLGKSYAQEEIDRALTNKVLSQSELKSGRTKINIRDITGKQVEKEIKIQNADKILEAIEKKERIERAKRLGLDRRMNIDILGTRIEKEGGAVKTTQLGRASRVNIGTNRLNERIFVKQSIQTEEAGKEILASFKLTKSGKRQAERVLISDLEKDQRLLFRKSYPSEAEKRFIEMTNAPPVNIERVDTFKQIGAFKGKGNVNVRELQADDKLIRELQKEGINIKIGGKGKGVLSEEEILNIPETPIAFTKQKPVPVSKFKSRELQILDQGKGITFEQAGTEEIIKPLETEIIKESKPSKPFKIKEEKIVDIEYPKPEKIKLEETQILEEPKPKMVGGEGLNIQESRIFTKSLSPEEVGFINVKPPRIPETEFKMTNEYDKLFGGGINIETPKTGSSQKIKIESELNINKEIEKTRNIPRTESLINEAFSTKQKTGQNTAEKLAESQKLVPKQIATPKLDFPEMFKPSTRRPSFPKDTGFFEFPAFPPLRRVQTSPEIPDVYNDKQFKKAVESYYTASLSEAVFDTAPVEVTPSQLKKLNKTIFSGFELRPTLRIKKKKKRKS